ncbi:hypothetical protein GC173_08200 [bacterium]|nr:hypothetical protein [bacterium]
MGYFGDTSRIDRTIAGVPYGLAVRFWMPSTQAPSLGAEPQPEAVVSGIIEEVQALGGGSYRLRMRRGPQTFFYVIPPLAPGQGSIEVPYTCEMGGNVAMTREWMRGYSHLNGEYAVRGSMMGTRTVPGDGAIIQRDRPTLPAMVTRADAHAWAPEEVNFAGSDPLPVIRYLPVELYDIRASRTGPTLLWANLTGRDVDEGERINTAEWTGTATAAIPQGASGTVAVDLDGEVVFDGENSGLLPTGLVIWNDDTPTLAERVQFTPPGGIDPDPDYLPESFGVGLSGAQYWWDPADRSVRLASSCAYSGDEADLVWWVRTRENVPGENSGGLVVVESGPGDGPTAEYDNCVVSAWETAGDGDWVFSIQQGSGLVEWRTSARVDSRRVTLVFGAAGPTGASVREADGESGEALAFLDPAPVYTAPWQARIVKSGDAFALYGRQSGGDSWTELATVAIAGVVADTDGLTGIGSFGEASVRFAGVGSSSITRLLLRIGSDGTHAVLRSTGRKPFLIAADLGLPAADVVEVRNLSTDQAMSLGSSVRRDQYRVVGGQLYAVAENSGDRWRVTYAASGTPPAAPGRAPRPVSGQVERGWVELRDDPNPDFLPTANVAANKANWHDLIEVAFEDGTVPVAGEQIDFVRWGVFDPSDPPALHYAIRDDDGSESWRSLPPEAFRAFWFAGLVLITQAWLDANVDVGELLCIRAEGKTFKSDLLADADRWGELRDAVRSLDELWVRVPVGGWNESAQGGEAWRTIGVTAWNELGQATAVGVGLSHGTYSAAVLPPADPPYSPGGPGVAPYWFSSPGIASTGFYDSILRNGYVFDGVSPPESTIIEGDAELLVWPFPGGWYGGSPLLYMGQRMPAPNNLYPADYVGALYATRGFPFSPGGIFARLPSSAVIEGAWLEAKFSGLRQQQWSVYQEIGPGTVVHRLEYWNGTRVFEYERNAAGEVVTDYFHPDPDSVKWVEGATLSFDVIGKRLDSSNVRDWFGNVIDVPAHEYVSVGGNGLGGTSVPTDEWCQVAVTGALRSLLAMRSSLTAADSYELWPSFGTGPGTSSEGLSGFVAGLMPATTYVQSGEPADPKLTLNVSGKWVEYNSLDLGPLVVRFRLGRDAGTARPINPPPAA